MMLRQTYRGRRVLGLLVAGLLGWALLWSIALASTVKNLPFKLVPSFADLEPLTLAPAERQWLAAHPRLRVGIAIDDYQPIDITRDRNRYQGISADYLGLVGERLDVTMEVLGFSEREQAVEALRNGTIDVLTSANGYERGLSGLRFTSDYMPDRAVVVVRRDGSSLSDDLAGKKLVLLDGYANAEQVHAAYPNSQIMLSPNLYSGLEALNQGDADAFIGNEIIVRAYKALRPYLAVRIEDESRLPPTGFAFATRDDNAVLAGLLEQALQSIDESLQREIQARWTTGLGANISGERIELSAEEQAWILQHPHVMVASQQYPPSVFKDKEGRWAGLNIDLLNRISRMTGLHFVHKESLSTAQTLELLESGQAQMNSTLTASEDRRLFLNFSHAFGGAAWVFVVRSEDRRLSSLEQLAGEVLALPARHTLESFIRRHYPDIRLRSVSNYEEARALVSSGEARATIQNEVQVQGLNLADDGLRVGRSVEGTWSADEFAVRKDQPELLSILNKSLEALPVAELSAIRLKWLGATPVPMPAWQRVPTWVYWAVATALLFGLASLAWSSRLKLQIQQRLNAEKRLNDQLAFMRALLDGIPNPIFVRDLEGRLITCNKSYEQQLGTSLELIRGRQLTELDLLPPETARLIHAEIMQLLASEQSVFADRQVQTRHGLIHAYQWTVPFYSAEGHLQGLLGGWIDITERKHLENQLLDARQAADQANAAKSAFLSTMSHEIRTPMTAIVGLLELEKEQARIRGVPFSEALRVAYQSAQELISLMGDSLDLAKIEAGHMQLVPQVTALKPFFESVRQLFEVTARNQGVHLQLLFSAAAQGRYVFDPLRLRQVLHNLLSNALKFTAEGEVRVTVERQPDEQGVECLRISVADTGPGISAEQQANIFTPFVQADAMTSSTYGGTGLGLSICRQLIELMGGRIHLSSEPGAGTVVSIELYLERVSDDLEPQASPSAERPPSRSIEVLVVDDLSANRMVLSQQLMFLGHRVVACDNAQEALQQWRSGAFDVLMTDCNMPQMSGYALTEAIRRIEAQEGRQRCPVIGCTANAFEDERERCERAGMDQLLVKPVTLDQLAQSLARFLPALSFNIQTLRGMTQADEPVLQRMLQELLRNLDQEQQALEEALAAQDWRGLGGTLHRLKGVCCLIDALPLAKACIALEELVKGQQAEALASQWPELQDVMRVLRSDIQAALGE